MAAIRLLDEVTINQIAAGEVIESPASVLKELIENSLDAGARRIAVRAESRGDLSVSDDGAGMGPEDVRLAVERHATSKIATSSDLQALRTYGFRGEALPSIGAVSQLEIQSRRAQDATGLALTVRGGQTVRCEPVARPPGTAVVVSDLFFNTPVRQKFMRSERTERMRVLGAVERLALARPDVAFTAHVEGRLALTTPGTGSPTEALLAMYGLDVARDVWQVRYSDPAEETGARSITVLAGGPATARGDRRHQAIWVNRRPVAVKGLLEAAMAAYPFGVLPGRRFPLLYLMLELPPEEVDANVHPTKAEVRLAASGNAFRLVTAAMRQLATERPAGAQYPIGRLASVPGEDQPAAGGGGGMVHRSRSGGWWPGSAGNGFAADLTASPALLAESAEPWGVTPGVLPRLRPLGQSGGRWLVCDGPGGLFVIDQHAAHERVLFESLGGDDASGHGGGDAGGGRARQLLAIPVALDLSPSDYTVWTESREELAALGLDTEQFGVSSVVVRTVPAGLAGLAGDAARRLVADVLAALASDEEMASALPPRLRARRSLASCLAAVKGGQVLSAAEMDRLVTDLAACTEPLRCPHGRPTVVALGHGELGRRFGRR